jgi:DNA-binding XRE family transcriptional regulator
MTTKNKRLIDVLEKLDGPFTFATYMRGSRTTLDLTQAEMARKVGISRAMLCDIEKGRQLVSVSLAIKIARKAGFLEKVAVETCLQDQLRKAGVSWQVKIAS